MIANIVNNNFNYRILYFFSFIKHIKIIKKENMSDAPDVVAIVAAAVDAARQQENPNIRRKSRR